VKRKNNPARTGQRLPHKVRIIGGRWRGRRLPVVDAPGLRPTPDRVRETLFNWLQPYIEGAACLDLFAGTGALGLEAASRGAGRVVMVESSPALARGLREQANHLAAENVEVVQGDAVEWLSAAPSQSFDIVFLDPPFARGLIERACGALIAGHWLNEGALLYIESETGPETAHELLQKIRHERAGQVQYALFEFHEKKYK
jgi:16S rRNA (guanine966-N2)-methyltransferase